MGNIFLLGAAVFVATVKNILLKKCPPGAEFRYNAVVFLTAGVLCVVFGISGGLYINKVIVCTAAAYALFSELSQLLYMKAVRDGDFVIFTFPGCSTALSFFPCSTVGS